jgi:hypothetical protein
VPRVAVPDPAAQAVIPVSRRDRRLAERQLSGVDLLSELNRKTKVLAETHEAKQAAVRISQINQALFEAELPQRVAQRCVETRIEVVEAYRILQQATDLYRQEAVNAQRLAALNSERHETALLEERIKKQKLKGELSRAEEVGERMADAQCAEWEAAVARNLASASESQARRESYRATKQERRSARFTDERDAEEDDLGRSGFSKTMREQMARSAAINGDRKAARERIADIERRARREKRELSDDELEKIDALRDSLAAAEAVHKTTAAADLGLEEE